MEQKNTNHFSGLIDMIKASTIEEKFKIIAVKMLRDKIVYGEMNRGSIARPFELNLTDNNNFCQNLYDILICEFGEQLCPGYSHNFYGSYEYFMTIGNNVMIFFPTGDEYKNWIYNQVQKDNEKIRRKSK